MYQLRDYQVKGDRDIREAFKAGFKSVCYCLPTGGGKTVVFSNIALGAMKKNSSVYILTHRDKLLRQAHEHLVDLGVPHGLIKSGYSPSPFEAIQVCSKDTLVNRLEAVTRKPDIIITDECHHAVSSTYRKIYDSFPNALHLGVTATPVRLDGKGLGSVFQTIVLGPSTRELMDMGYLSKYVLYGSPDELDFSGIKKTGGDFNTHQLDELLDKPKIIGDTIREYKRLAMGRKAVAFCCTIKHAQEVANSFNANGIPSISIDGKLSVDEIAKRLFDFQMGKYWVLTSCDLISEGMDIPAIDCIIMIRPTMSLSLYLQMGGRGLRMFAGKTVTIIIDQVNNYARHGLLDDPRIWTLDDYAPRTKAESDKQKDDHKLCPECFLYHDVPPFVCPGCGYVYTVKEKRTVEQIEGELIAINEAKEALERQKIYERNMLIWSCKSYDDFVNAANKLGYKRYWAIRRWEEYQKKHKKKAS